MCIYRTFNFLLHFSTTQKTPVVQSNHLTLLLMTTKTCGFKLLIKIEYQIVYIYIQSINCYQSKKKKY